MPLSIIVATLLLSQGVVQSWHSGFAWTTTDGAEVRSVIGPFASQEAIKELGTNGGGTLSANSAHPFSNPTPFSNLVEILALLVIPVCLTRTYGTLVRDRRQGLTLLGVMAGIWAIMLTAVWIFESHPSGGAASAAAGAMMEGKEVRFGIPGSALFAVSTTGTSTGAVNSAHDSFSAGGGGTVLWNMLLGEVAPGGGRIGTVRNPGDGDDHRLRRWTSGRPVADVPRKADRPARDDDGGALCPRHAGTRARGYGDLGDPDGDGGRRKGTAASRVHPVRSTVSARFSTPTRRRPTTTAVPSAGSR